MTDARGASGGRAIVGEIAETAGIVGFSTLAAVVYGIAHDQVTAHLCVEYFSIAHPPVFDTDSPLLLGLGWGIIATWWVGLPLGLGLAAAARLGSAPRLGLTELRSPIVKLMVASAIAALIAGAMGATLFVVGVIGVPGLWGAVIQPDRQAAFTADAWAHLVSYGFGILGGLFLIGHTIRRRLSGPGQPGRSPSVSS